MVGPILAFCVDLISGFLGKIAKFYARKFYPRKLVNG